MKGRLINEEERSLARLVEEIQGHLDASYDDDDNYREEFVTEYLTKASDFRAALLKFLAFLERH